MRMLGSCLGVLVGLGAGTARADAVDDLEPGTWFEVPDSLMRDVCPPDTPEYDWSFYCSNAIDAWGGGALDTSRGRLIIWGGGHGDYKGNEVYVFDLQTLQWERIWGPTPDAQIPSGGAHEVYDDGNPGSRHTYSGLTYVPPPHDALVTMGGSLWQSGSWSGATWSFSFEAGSWTRLADVAGEQGFGDPSVYDPQTEHIFRRANSRMLEYDPDADVYTDRAPSDGGFWAANVSAALDLSTRTMVIIGDERLDLYHLDSDTYEQDVAITGPDVQTLFGGNSPGVGYDEQQDRIVVWGGGLDVYTLDLDALSFSQFAGSGDDPGPITPSGGAFGRFRYAPSRNVFVSVNDADQNVFVFRMSEGTGVPPDPPGGEESGTGSDESGSATGGASADATSGTADDGGSTGPPGEGSGGSDGGSATAGEDNDDGGCACRTRSGGRDAPWLWVLLGFVAFRRRRSS